MDKYYCVVVYFIYILPRPLKVICGITVLHMQPLPIIWDSHFGNEERTAMSLLSLVLRLLTWVLGSIQAGVGGRCYCSLYMKNYSIWTCMARREREGRFSQGSDSTTAGPLHSTPSFISSIPSLCLSVFMPALCISHMPKTEVGVMPCQVGIALPLWHQGFDTAQPYRQMRPFWNKKVERHSSRQNVLWGAYILFTGPVLSV